jgi:hypothetical protein
LPISVPGATTPLLGWTSCSGILRFFAVGVKSMVYSSTTLAESGPARIVLPPSIFASLSKSPSFTACAFSGSPLWNLTPLRKKKRQVLGGLNSQRSASNGLTS